ncbi:hypothetical protein K440DRAFT_609056 [Wilcoxina mikolae CBS 423.85]|nr:hypothetical protein K440DRAFT_609056 [Wilcoxina mikolae CBS 423.85]
MTPATKSTPKTPSSCTGSKTTHPKTPGSRSSKTKNRPRRARPKYAWKLSPAERRSRSPKPRRRQVKRTEPLCTRGYIRRCVNEPSTVHHDRRCKDRRKETSNYQDIITADK